MSSPSSTTRISGTSTTLARLPNPPTFVECKDLRFLIMDAPSDRNLDLYMQEMERYHVTDVVRACEPTYDRGVLEKKGIEVHDWPFNDGEAPPDSVVNDWLNLVESRFVGPTSSQLVLDGSTNGHAGARSSSSSTASPPSQPNGVNSLSPTTETKKGTIAVHCVAGLGRAPLLVAMALIEFGNMPPLDSVIFIRERRRGAINARQLKFIEGYKKRRKKKISSGDGKCVVM